MRIQNSVDQNNDNEHSFRIDEQTATRVSFGNEGQAR